MMGLFPKIQRAWLSIDSDIYVWTYEDGGDLSYFDGLSEPIISVELVNPKPGIFQPHIQYLLCLATTAEIVLLGVSFAGSNTTMKKCTYFLNHSLLFQLMELTLLPSL